MKKKPRTFEEFFDNLQFHDPALKRLEKNNFKRKKKRKGKKKQEYIYLGIGIKCTKCGHEGQLKANVEQRDDLVKWLRDVLKNYLGELI